MRQSGKDRCCREFSGGKVRSTIILSHIFTIEKYFHIFFPPTHLISSMWNHRKALLSYCNVFDMSKMFCACFLNSCQHEKTVPIQGEYWMRQDIQPFIFWCTLRVSLQWEKRFSAIFNVINNATIFLHLWWEEKDCNLIPS